MLDFDVVVKCQFVPLGHTLMFVFRGGQGDGYKDRIR